MKFNPEKLRIDKIDILKMNVSSESAEYPIDIRQFEIFTDQEARIGFNSEIKSAKVTLNYNIIPTKDGEKFETLGANIVIDFYISIENYGELIKEQNDQLDVDNHLIVNLVAVSFSTGRGIIYAKLHSTHLEKVILPVIDPKNLIRPFKED